MLRVCQCLPETEEIDRKIILNADLARMVFELPVARRNVAPFPSVLQRSALNSFTVTRKTCRRSGFLFTLCIALMTKTEIERKCCHGHSNHELKIHYRCPPPRPPPLPVSFSSPGSFRSSHGSGHSTPLTRQT
jgi:hypothetical protein